MELTGSLTERRFRSNLRKLQYVLIDHPRRDDMIEAVTGIAGAKPGLFVLDSFPDNGGDHFVLLVNDDQIVELDAARSDKSPIVIGGTVPLKKFTRKLSLINKIMVAVALDMQGQF
ncbi:MAG: hypothetical protein HKN11_16100 [Rhizobiales bacterium]|nr:hypothetical protein [Hyphomicrobiales bacterium]